MRRRANNGAYTSPAHPNHRPSLKRSLTSTTLFLSTLTESNIGCKLDTYGQTEGQTGGQTEGQLPTTSSTGEAQATLTSFKFTSLELIDPHLFTLDAPCKEFTPTVNDGFKYQIENDIYKLLLHIELQEDMMPTAELKQAASCSTADNTCVDGAPISPQTPVLQSSMEACRALDTSVIAEPNRAGLNDPQPDCLYTPSGTLEIPLIGASPIVLNDAQLAFKFDNNINPSKISDGILYGFWPQNLADSTFFGDVPIGSNLNPPNCDTQFPDLLPSSDTININRKPVLGVWMAFNFTASRIDLLKE